MENYKKGQRVMLKYQGHLSGVNGRPFSNGKYSGMIAKIARVPKDPNGKFRLKIVGQNTYCNFRSKNFSSIEEQEEKLEAREVENITKTDIPESTGLWSKLKKFIWK